MKYKDTFGFKQHLFVHRQHLKQFGSMRRLWAAGWGSRIVVTAWDSKASYYALKESPVSKKQRS
jgi:hypothetical protein